MMVNASVLTINPECQSESIFYKIKMKMYQPNRVIQLSVMYLRRLFELNQKNVSNEFSNPNVSNVS